MFPQYLIVFFVIKNMVIILINISDIIMSLLTSILCFILKVIVVTLNEFAYAKYIYLI